MYAFELGQLPQVYTHATGGREYGGYFEMGYNAQSGQHFALGRKLPRPMPEVIVGFALRPNEIGNHGPEYFDYDFLTLGYAGAAKCAFRVDPSGAVVCQGPRPVPYYPDLSGTYAVGTHGDGGIHLGPDLGSTSPGMAPFQQWHYWEFRIGYGRATIYRDGKLLTEIVGDVTGPTGTFDTVYLGKISGKDAGYGNFARWRYDYDDFYLLDSLGPSHNQPLGDIKIRTLWTLAEGAHSDWLPTPGVANFEDVHDKPWSDGDLSYIGSAATLRTDTYGMEHVPVGRILGAQYSYTIRTIPPSRLKFASVTRSPDGSMATNQVRNFP